jgi:hypothetical protein
MSFLTSLWAKILGKLGVIGTFLPMIAAQVSFAIKEGDVGEVRFRAQQLRELGEKLVSFADLAEEVTVDDNLTLVEGSQLALAIEQILDEAMDVGKGRK